MTLVLLAAGAMALVDPGRVESLGFRLSVAASLALALVLPSLMARGWGSGLAVVVAATAAAQVATLPFLLAGVRYGVADQRAGQRRCRAAGGRGHAVGGYRRVWPGCCGNRWPNRSPHPRSLPRIGLIAAVDLLGAPDAYVSVGVPPLAAIVVMAFDRWWRSLRRSRPIRDALERHFRRRRPARPEDLASSGGVFVTGAGAAAPRSGRPT